MNTLQRISILLFLITTSASPCFSQWSIKPLKRIKINKTGVPYGQFSGITPINDSTYAIVHDKSDSIYYIRMDNHLNVKYIGAKEFHNLKKRDPEGIAYIDSTNTFFVSGEEDQKIIEYNTDGTITGRELYIPYDYRVSNRRGNAGFESLSYNKRTNCFWTTTEQGIKTEPINMHHLLCFDGASLKPKNEDVIYYSDSLDEPSMKRLTAKGRYANGISDILALDDGTLIVMERECFIPRKKIGAWCKISLYHFNPSNKKKLLLHQFKTRISLIKINFANYEGLCVGPTQTDGTKTILLINDSQGGAGNSFARIKDYIKVYTFSKFE